MRLPLGRVRRSSNSSRTLIPVLRTSGAHLRAQCFSRRPFYASRCHLPLFPSTKSAFLCAFALRNPHFRPFRAQNRGFCVRKGNFSPVLPPFEHKIGFFVSKWAIFPRFWVVLTQNRHFCARGWLPRVQQCPLKPSRAHRSSAPPATSPAGCILQQCARQ